MNKQRSLKISSATHRKWVIWIILVIGLASPVPLFTITTLKAPPNLLDAVPHSVEDPMGTIHTGDFNMLKTMGCQWLRLDFLWSDIEPSPGVFNFANYDNAVNQSLASGIKILGILGYGVNWLNGSGGLYVPPADIPYFVDYVNTTVLRYKDKVAAWESWNEPNLSWSGPIGDFFQFLNASINTIYKIDPKILYVVGDLASSQPDYLDAMFRAGIMVHATGISFHPYFLMPRNFLMLLREDLDIGSKYHFSGQYWVTEVGTPTGGDFLNHDTLQDQANQVIYTYTMATALNISAVIWYQYMDDSNPYGLLFSNGTWKPGAYAFKLFSEFCTHSDFRSDLIQYSPSLAGINLISALYRRTGGESALILWNQPALSDNETVSVNINLNAQTGSITQWDPATDNNQSCIENNGVVSFQISATPIFITFNVNDANSLVSLSIGDSILLITVISVLPVMIGICVVWGVKIKKKNEEDKPEDELKDSTNATD
jgi:hypothetical protein